MIRIGQSPLGHRLTKSPNCASQRVRAAGLCRSVAVLKCQHSCFRQYRVNTLCNWPLFVMQRCARGNIRSLPSVWLCKYSSDGGRTYHGQSLGQKSAHAFRHQQAIEAYAKCFRHSPSRLSFSPLAIAVRS